MILDEIIEYKRTEIDGRKQTVPLAEMQERIQQAPPARPFAETLRRSSQGKRRAARAAGEQALPRPAPPALIAEIKGKSPSKGSIRENVNALEIAKVYEAGGAACLSILTDSRFFGGALERIPTVREHVRLPILQKDFIVEPYQVFEARAHGADCVLLIVAALEADVLKSLYGQARELGMDALVEAHTMAELDFAVASGFELIGINNRNLATFDVTLETTEKLAASVPSERILVGESGIFEKCDVDRLAQAGVDAVLVGEALMASEDIEAKVRELAGVSG
ncbi:MAG: indole-3-glycerol phosphate synthase TrpC [Armatimonadetes bacterium]|nr:indole-3-glycerol phosphate synthase TrpC [Armatimonadota bacterium]